MEYREELSIAKKAEQMLTSALRNRTQSFQEHYHKKDNDKSLKEAEAKASVKKYGKKKEGNQHVFMRSLAILMPSAGEISFIPFPNPPGGRLIHLFFENQNLVLDWLTCTGDYHRKFDFTHITNETNGEKFGALETETLVLNTGWILREEIELINALIKSSFCFIIIENKIIKARPMNKKNEIFNTAEQLYSTDLEFNIKQNER